MSTNDDNLPSFNESNNSLDLAWRWVVRDLLVYGEQVAPRDIVTREILNHTMVVDMKRPVLTNAARKLGYRFMAAEAAWILSGSDRVDALRPFSQAIADFSDDGVTFFGAYGPRLREQLDYVVEKLRQDRHTRQAVASIWRVNPPTTRDYPCTLSSHFLVRDGTLHQFVTMRSSDAWLGVPYDVFSFSMWAGYVLLALGDRQLKLGTLYQTAASRHLYERNFEAAGKACAERADGFTYAPFNWASFPDPDSLVEHLWAVARREETPYDWLAELPK